MRTEVKDSEAERKTKRQRVGERNRMGHGEGRKIHMGQRENKKTRSPDHLCFLYHTCKLTISQSFQHKCEKKLTMLKYRFKLTKLGLCEQDCRNEAQVA